MHISDNRNITPKVKFKELEPGDVFEYGGLMHMKISDVESNLGSIICNAVALANGKAKHFRGEDAVTLLQHELIIKG